MLPILRGQTRFIYHQTQRWMRRRTKSLGFKGRMPGHIHRFQKWAKVASRNWKPGEGGVGWAAHSFDLQKGKRSFCGLSGSHTAVTRILWLQRLVVPTPMTPKPSFCRARRRETLTMLRSTAMGGGRPARSSLYNPNHMRVHHHVGSRKETRSAEHGVRYLHEAISSSPLLR